MAPSRPERAWPGWTGLVERRGAVPARLVLGLSCAMAESPLLPAPGSAHYLGRQTRSRTGPWCLVPRAQCTATPVRLAGLVGRPLRASCCCVSVSLSVCCCRGAFGIPAVDPELPAPQLLGSRPPDANMDRLTASGPRGGDLPSGAAGRPFPPPSRRERPPIC